MHETLASLPHLHVVKHQDPKVRVHTPMEQKHTQQILVLSPLPSSASSSAPLPSPRRVAARGLPHVQDDPGGGGPSRLGGPHKALGVAHGKAVEGQARVPCEKLWGNPR